MIKPNILWILCDQMRGQALSHMGDPNVSTPHLDRMAAEGITFGQARSGTPVCTPFRGTALTGLYPHQSGITHNQSRLPETLPTVATLLREQGYDTAWFGKWHLDGSERREDWDTAGNSEKSTSRAGFDTWLGYQNRNRPFDVRVHGPGPASAEVSLPGYEPDVLTDQLLQWIESHDKAAETRTRPFFAVVSMQPPHAPYVAPAVDMARHHPAAIRWRDNVPPVARIRERAGRELAGYYAAIEHIDGNVGRIRASLERLGLHDHTYLLFFSDHGDMHGSHGAFRKSTAYEEAVRIPLIVGGPPVGHQNYRQSQALVAGIDLLPTTLGLAGVNAPGQTVGHDFSPLIRKEPSSQTLPSWSYLSLYHPSGTSYGMDRPFRGIVTADGWKLVVLPHQPWLLFNLFEDPYELANVAYHEAFASERRRLSDVLRAAAQSTGDDFAWPEE